MITSEYRQTWNFLAAEESKWLDLEKDMNGKLTHYYALEYVLLL